MKTPEGKFESRIEARPIEEVFAGEQEMIPYIEPVEFEPPIAMPLYEEFDAAKSFADLKGEAAAMREKKLPPEERRGKIRARVGEVRERLARQENGIAEAIKTLLGAIEKNPDENDRDLFRRVAELAPMHHFTGDQLRNFWNAIVEYRVRHSNIERVRNEYPDDAALFAACFGRKTAGKVEVVKRPMMLYFRCYDDRDYIIAFNVSEIGGDEKKLTDAMQARALATGGGRIPRTNIAELGGTVAAGRTSMEAYSQEYDERTRAHEEQHVVNKLFIPLAARMSEEAIMAHVARAAETVDEGRRMLMRELARSARAAIGIDNEARDEILAHYEGGLTPEKIVENLTTLPAYDYKNSEWHKADVAELPKAIAGKMMREMSAVLYVIDEQGKEKVHAAGPLATQYSEVEPYVEKALGDDYNKDLARWVGAIETLEKKGYSRDDIVAMLYGERVPDWQSFARRAPEKQKK